MTRWPDDHDPTQPPPFRSDAHAQDTDVQHEQYPPSPGATQPADAQTARHDLMDGKVIALENYRPANDERPDTPEELAEYALGELEPFIQLAKEGKIRAIGIAVELVDDRSSITYPVGQWEPGLIAAVELLKLRLLQQWD